MFKLGIIDPLKVTRMLSLMLYQLRTMLTTNCVISNREHEGTRTDCSYKDTERGSKE